jgi:hypothetical protein
MIHSMQSAYRLADKVATLLGPSPDDCDVDELANLALMIAEVGALEALRFYRSLPLKGS